MYQCTSKNSEGFFDNWSVDFMFKQKIMLLNSVLIRKKEWKLIFSVEAAGKLFIIVLIMFW